MSSEETPGEQQGAGKEGTETPDMGALGDVFNYFFNQPSDESLRKAVEERSVVLRRAEERVVKAREDLDRAGRDLQMWQAGVRYGKQVTE